MVRPSQTLLHVVLIGLVTIAGLAAAACGGIGDGSDVTDAAQEDLWAEVDRMDTSAFRHAWDALSARAHVQYARLEQYDEMDSRIAYREQTVEVPGASSAFVTLSSDSAGAFRFGMLGRVVDGRGGGPSPVDLVSYVLPEDAPFLRARNREKYLVELLPDSTFLGTAVRRIQIRARPEAGDGEAIRRVRYHVIPGSGRLVAAQLVRVTRSLLFTEQSRVFVGMQPDTPERLLPALTRYETRLRSRFGGDYGFRAVMAWYGIGR